jgi:hypothetical protein
MNKGLSKLGFRFRISGNQAAQIIGILARSAATSFMQQKPHSVDVGKQTSARWRRKIFRYQMGSDLGCFTFAVKLGQFGDLAAVELRPGETQLFLEGLFENLDVFVLAKDERNDQPVISSAHLPVGAVISEESFVPPLGNVGWRPMKLFRLFLERCGLMVDIADGQEFSRRDWLNCSTD